MQVSFASQQMCIYVGQSRVKSINPLTELENLTFTSEDAIISQSDVSGATFKGLTEKANYPKGRGENQEASDQGENVAGQVIHR